MELGLIKSVENNWIRDNFERFYKGITQRKIEKRANNIDIEEVEELIELLKTTKNDWKCSIMNYELVHETEMIDYYIYQIKAFELKFEYLMKKAKQKGIKVKAFKGL